MLNYDVVTIKITRRNNKIDIWFGGKNFDCTFCHNDFYRFLYINLLRRINVLIAASDMRSCFVAIYTLARAVESCVVRKERRLALP